MLHWLVSMASRSHFARCASLQFIEHADTLACQKNVKYKADVFHIFLMRKISDVISSFTDFFVISQGVWRTKWNFSLSPEQHFAIYSFQQARKMKIRFGWKSSAECDLDRELSYFQRTEAAGFFPGSPSWGREKHHDELDLCVSPVRRAVRNRYVLVNFSSTNFE